MNIYLDNNATTVLLPSVRRAVEEALCFYGNPSSFHAAGSKARKLVEETRNTVARYLNANSSEIIFTSGATESIATCFKSVLSCSSLKPLIIVSGVEHSAVLECSTGYFKQGYPVKKITVDRKGNLDFDQLGDVLKKFPGSFVSMLYVNNETGVMLPVETICELAHKHGAFVHIDAVQAIGKVPVDVKNINCDYLSISGHKFHALKGCGVLYVKKGSPFSSIVFGHQEAGRRGGTENVLGIVSMGAALEKIQDRFNLDCKEMASLRDILENGILENASGTFVNGDQKNRICNTTNITFPGKDAALLVESLSRKGIYVSTGSACTTGGEPSHVLRAMGLSKADINATLRLSVSKLNTREEIQRALPVIINTVHKYDMTGISRKG